MTTNGNIPCPWSRWNAGCLESQQSFHTRSLEPKQQREWQFPFHGRDCHEQVIASHWLLLLQLSLRPLSQWKSFDSTTENRGHTL